MNTHEHQLILPPPDAGLKLRDSIAVVFRRKRVIYMAAIASFVAIAIALWLMPAQYQSQMKLLIKRDRTELVMDGDAKGGQVAVRPLTEQEINSEIDLLQSEDLLRQVVQQAGLDAEKPAKWTAWLPRFGDRTDDQAKRTALAVARLQKNLKVEPPNKSNLITVRYTSPDPQMAARVLQLLGQLYLDKHLQVHRTPGAFDFFQKQSEHYRAQMEDAERQLAAFSRDKKIISAEQEKTQLMQQVATLEQTRNQTEAGIRETEYKIRDLERQLKETPQRIVTQVRTPITSVSALQANLYTLQAKRTELLQKYSPQYRTVQDLDQQITEAQKAIVAAQAKPLTEDTSDLNPVYAWLSSELAKSRSELAGYRARMRAESAATGSVRGRALQLGGDQIDQQRLQRAAKSAEENYQLYLRKQEEARIASELDQSRIVNVSLAEAAAVPALPNVSPMSLLPLAVLVAMIVGVMCGFAADYLDPRVHTPRELTASLGVPVLAVLNQGDKWWGEASPEEIRAA
ncbi:MAG TPA: hypothetical protein VM009_08040 [Terriglobales bacterium]|nr:hypothetical protein [Terriglobales bacterium]